MVIDKIENYGLYSGLGKNILLALEYLRKTDFANMEAGRYDIDGENMYVILVDYTTKRSADCQLEAHRKYMDVQYMVEGAEHIGYAAFIGQIPVTRYDGEKDVAFFKGELSFINLTKGMFAIFFPDDLHMPGVGENPSPVRKAVVKVKI